MKHVQTDVLLKDFWRVNERFADLFNTVFFHGESVICPEDLQEMDTDVSGIIEIKDYKETLTRSRDIVKKTAYGVDFIIMGIENQSHIHYAMPLRQMVYDALSYLKEYKIIADYNRKNRNLLTPDEFLSGMRKEDRLHPVISLIIYYNEKVWDGPFSLTDMFADTPEDIARFICDYKIHLLEIRKSQQYIFHNPDVQAVFEIVRDAFDGNINRIQEKYKDHDLPTDVVAVIGKIINFEELIHKNEDEEAVNMCTALEKWAQTCRDDGKKEERKQIIIKMLIRGMDEQDIIFCTEATPEEIQNARSEIN